jgi:hypothetical protein
LQHTEDKREKIQALSLAKSSYSMKLDLPTNSTVVDDAIRLVSSSKSKDKLKASSSNSDEYKEEESKEPDYDEAEDQLEKQQEDQREEITTTVTNCGNKSSLLKVMEWMSMYLCF